MTPSTFDETFSLVFVADVLFFVEMNGWEKGANDGFHQASRGAYKRRGSFDEWISKEVGEVVESDDECFGDGFCDDNSGDDG